MLIPNAAYEGKTTRDYHEVISFTSLRLIFSLLYGSALLHDPGPRIIGWGGSACGNSEIDGKESIAPRRSIA